MDADFPQRLQHVLNARTIQTLAEWEIRKAAVLAPLYYKDAHWHLLFTRRTDNLKEHSGQVSFPGGGANPEDSTIVHTALREAHEEIGLIPSAVTVLGQLDELITITRWRVTPVVGVIPYPYELTSNPDEIAAVFGVPLSWLADENNRETQERQSPIDGRMISINFYHPWEGHIIWGATAWMVQSLLDVLYEHRLPPYQP